LVSIAGILANPASGKDIRRLVAYGSVFDNQEKVRMARRLILGMERGGAKRIVYMPDAYGIVERALSAISIAIPATPIEMPLRNTQQDTNTAAELMETLGVACMVVLGGDGTSRAACKGAVNVPILPLSTGTNNVFPYMGEATIAGLAAGLAASGKLPIEQCCVQACMFDILRNQEAVDIALVDAAVYDDVFMASRAVWQLEKVPQLFLTRCRADAIGLSAIGGQLRSIRPEDPKGLALELGQPAQIEVSAAIAPGMFATVGVRSLGEMLPGEVHPIHTAPGMIAVDGEREVDIHRGDEMAIRLNTNGPKVVDVRRVMALAREHGIFTR
jgi:hypothetical protein